MLFELQFSTPGKDFQRQVLRPTYVLNTDPDWPFGQWLMNNPEDDAPDDGNPHPLPDDGNMQNAIEQNMQNFQDQADPNWYEGAQQDQDWNPWPMPEIP